MQIEACPRCLSTKLNYIPGQEYSALTAVGVTTGKALCEECKILITPVMFKSIRHYEQALKALKSKRKKQIQPSSTIQDLISDEQENKYSNLDDFSIIFGTITILAYLQLFLLLAVVSGTLLLEADSKIADLLEGIKDLLWRTTLITYVIAIFMAVIEILNFEKTNVARKHNLKDWLWILWIGILLLFSLLFMSGLALYWVYGRKNFIRQKNEKKVSA